MQGTLSNKNRTAIFFLTGARGGGRIATVIPPKTAALENARRSQRRAFCFSGAGTCKGGLQVGLKQTRLFSAETVRTKPDPLPLGVWIVMACALPSVSPCGLPCDALPLGGHDVLAFVATERDPEHRVVSVGNGPLSHV